MQALVTASERYHTPNAKRLLEALSGIIFLGCPHPKYEQRESWPYLSLLLKTVSRLPKLVLAKAELESNVLENSCRKFEEADFRVDVISAYETIETRIRSSLWRSQKSVVRKHPGTTSSQMFLLTKVVGRLGTSLDVSATRNPYSCSKRPLQYLSFPSGRYNFPEN
jgi:hypothetical protein